MDMRDAMELTKKYSTCPECGNDKVGGEPSQGALIIEDDIFTRSCKCGWSVTVDQRIKHVATLTQRRSGKLVGGVYEVRIHGRNAHKYLPLLELKEKSGVKRIVIQKLRLGLTAQKDGNGHWKCQQQMCSRKILCSKRKLI